MKFFFRSSIPALALTALSALAALLFWEQLPERLPIHFNIYGEPDRMAAKEIALFIMPAASLIVTLLMSAIARLDPALARDADGAPSVATFLAAVALLFLGIQAGILLTALYPESLLMGPMLLFAMGAFMIVLGLAMRRLPMNRWFGFRFPWNRDNRAVWRRTHDLYYRWMVVFGTLAIVAGFVWPLPAVSLALLALALLIPGVIAYRFARRGPPREGGGGGSRRGGRRRGGRGRRPPKPEGAGPGPS